VILMYRGIVEGFYGRPYKSYQRNKLLKYLSLHESPAYMYAPKNDPYHRLNWRLPYSTERWKEIADSIAFADRNDVRFFFGVSPWGFEDHEYGILRAKLSRALKAGAHGAAILFDDVPDRADADLAARQIRFAERAAEGLQTEMILCPSVYCDELNEKLDGSGYLEVWKEELPGDTGCFWTGPSVVSESLEGPSLDRAKELLGSRPVVWDNLLADDYAQRRIYLAGLEERIPDCHYFLNPSELFPVALYSLRSMLLSAGTSCPWPGELGETEEYWHLLSEFHHLPWQPGKMADLLFEELRRAMAGEEVEGLKRRLASITRSLSIFTDELESVDEGSAVMPYVRDVAKMVGWWREILMLPSRSERESRLQYLMFQRLPYDHPMALVTAGLAQKKERGAE
ncbi:MAG: hypothetical protein GF388_05350, partial [Candidatus Aegiribacteria sp.]|nr:hypothetical protein [Candidatus Aegiribacteria sp.]MBD3294634.1 hypothetical protein [Candidatus Fermentibacteria bacterium]